VENSDLARADTVGNVCRAAPYSRGAHPAPSWQQNPLICTTFEALCGTRTHGRLLTMEVGVLGGGSEVSGFPPCFSRIYAALLASSTCSLSHPEWP